MDNDIEGLNYTPIGSKTSQPMMPVHRSMIKWIRDWSFYLANESGKRCLSDEQWKEINTSQFKEFNMMVKTGQFSALSKPLPDLLLTNLPNLNKRDVALCLVLKDNRHWNNWNHSVLAQASVDDLKEVFDLENEPKEEDKKLFDEKQKFAYTVLN